MYRFLERIGPDEQEAIAMQLYLEMLKAGYTSVGEFHYLHHDPAGKPYANPAEMAERVRAAAAATGMRLTLLPVFYAHSDFGGAPPLPAQRRFIHDVDSFRALFSALAQQRGDALGIAPHSLRAVTPTELGELCQLAHAGEDGTHQVYQPIGEQLFNAGNVTGDALNEVSLLLPAMPIQRQALELVKKVLAQPCAEVLCNCRGDELLPIR